MQAAKQLAQHVGVARACEALNVPRSSYYATYRPRPPKTKLRRPSHRKLTSEEERHVLAVLNSPRFMDMSPREIYATLLDEGIYLCSVSTMYRILRAHNQVRERRNQRIHPPCAKPRLVATRPNVIAGTKMALPHFWCNPAADWRNPLESREPLCDRFAWGFAVCGDFFEASGWSFAVRSFRRHTLPSPSRARRSVHRVLRAAVSPAAGTA